MGGIFKPDWLIDVPPSIGNLLKKVIRMDAYYSCAGVRIASPTEIEVKDGEGSERITINDDLIEVFQFLKNAGENSAFVVDRAFGTCSITTWELALSYLDYRDEDDDRP